MAMDPKLGKRFRKMIIPRPGHLLVEADYTAFHALTTGFEAQDLGYMRLARLDIHSYVTAHMIRDPDRDKLITLPDDELGDRLNWIKEEKSPFYKSKQTNFIRNKQAKPCIAEGQLVLTNHGLIPIERVSLAHMVWDGVEFVPHDGVVAQGIKDVIEHDGLLATPDHEVYLNTGGTVSLYEAKQSNAKLAKAWTETQSRVGSGSRMRVYDILNAGPRSRFMVSGKLVANCILGIGFGLGDKHAYEMNEEYFSSIKEVTAIKQLLKGLFPKVFQWQDKVRLEAHDLGYLTTLHGYIRYFWDVYRWDPKRRETVPGEDSERAIAFRPANDAFGHIKDTKLRLARRPEGNLLREYGFINPMHDAILFDCPVDRVEECLRTVKWEMERKSEILKNIVVPDGLWCGVETMVGPNWAEMKVVHWKGDEILWPEGMEIGRFGRVA